MESEDICFIFGEIENVSSSIGDVEEVEEVEYYPITKYLLTVWESVINHLLTPFQPVQFPPPPRASISIEQQQQQQAL